MILKIRSRKFFELQPGLAILIIGMSGLGLVWLNPDALSLIPPCLFRHWTGIPCPACGATSAGIHLSRLEIKAAIFSSPLFTLFYLALALTAFNAVIGLLFGRNVSLQLSSSEQKFFRAAALLVILFNWVYLVTTTLAK